MEIVLPHSLFVFGCLHYFRTGLTNPVRNCLTILRFGPVLVVYWYFFIVI